MRFKINKHHFMVGGKQKANIVETDVSNII